jgi:hypothetical protein
VRATTFTMAVFPMPGAPRTRSLLEAVRQTSVQRVERDAIPLWDWGDGRGWTQGRDGVATGGGEAAIGQTSSWVHQGGRRGRIRGCGARWGPVRQWDRPLRGTGNGTDLYGAEIGRGMGGKGMTAMSG